MSFISAREKSGLTQAEAARQLGVSDSAVCYWETGKYMPRASLLPSIAKLYKCKVEKLLEGNPAYPPGKENGGD